MVRRLALFLIALGALAVSGCNSTGITLVSITADGEVFSGGTPILADEGETLSLRVTVTDFSGTVSYEWEIDDDAGTLSDPNDESTDWVLPSVMDDGDYTARVTMEDDSGNTLDAEIVIRIS